MAEPIKHAPGVVCIISVREPARNHIVTKMREHNNGRTCVILGPSSGQFQRDGGNIVTCTYVGPDDKAWLVRSDTPLMLTVNNRIKGYRAVLSHTRVFLQRHLIPIAGPGIDMSEPTSVETPVPNQSPVPETA